MEGRPVLLAQIGIGAVAIFIGLLVIYGGMSPPAAPPRPKPLPSVAEIGEEMKFSQPIYKALLEQDGKRFAVAVPTMEQLGEPIAYFDEIRGERALRPGKAIDTRHLKIVLQVEKQQGTVDGQSFKTDHLVLHFTNKTNKYLAYRIETVVPVSQKCNTKGDLQHDAIVLPPSRSVARTECLYHDGFKVDLRAVEVMELLPLSAYYLSRLPPTLVLYDPRTSSGHAPLAQPLCRQTVPWQEIRDGIAKNEFQWKDVMDFYARHSCDEYAFFRSYRYREDNSLPLPVRP